MPDGAARRCAAARNAIRAGVLSGSPTPGQHCRNRQSLRAAAPRSRSVPIGRTGSASYPAMRPKLRPCASRSGLPRERQSPPSGTPPNASLARRPEAQASQRRPPAECAPPRPCVDPWAAQWEDAEAAKAAGWAGRLRARHQSPDTQRMLTSASALQRASLIPEATRPARLPRAYLFLSLLLTHNSQLIIHPPYPSPPPDR